MAKISLKDLRRIAEEDQLSSGRYGRMRRDELTDLVDHASLLRALDLAAREEGGAGLILIEVDRLRKFNEAFGRDTGDRYLVRVARSLESLVGDQTILARCGGARFALLEPGFTDQTELVLLAGDCGSVVRQTITDRSVSVQLTASVGVAVAPDHAGTGPQLWRAAETALFLARLAGKDRASLFRPSVRTALQHSAREGLGRGHFQLIYQPSLTLAEPRTVFAVEAFLRWHHPVHGLMFPADFRPLIEEEGLAEELGGFVIREAARAGGRWHREGLPFGRVGINLSPAMLAVPDLDAQILTALAEGALPPARFMVEVPEGLLIEGAAPAIIESLERLRGAGVSVALDGAPGSVMSFEELAVIPFDVLKLDRSYTQDHFSAERLSYLLAMAPQHDVSVVLEGIEDAALIPHLRRSGCTYGQGYVFRRPMTEAKIEAWLRGAVEVDGEIERV